MKDFGTRFSVALALFAFGTAGAVSLYGGSMVSTALFRGSVAGALFLAAGRLLAVVLSEGEFKKPEMPPEVRVMPTPEEKAE